MQRFSLAIVDKEYKDCFKVNHTDGLTMLKCIIAACKKQSISEPKYMSGKPKLEREAMRKRIGVALIPHEFYMSKQNKYKEIISDSINLKRLNECAKDERFKDLIKFLSSIESNVISESFNNLANLYNYVDRNYCFYQENVYDPDEIIEKSKGIFRSIGIISKVDISETINKEIYKSFKSIIEYWKYIMNLKANSLYQLLKKQIDEEFEKAYSDKNKFKEDLMLYIDIVMKNEINDKRILENLLKHPEESEKWFNIMIENRDKALLAFVAFYIDTIIDFLEYLITTEKPINKFIKPESSIFEILRNVSKASSRYSLRKTFKSFRHII